MVTGSRDPLAAAKVAAPVASEDAPAPAPMVASSVPLASPSKKDKGKWKEKSGWEKQVPSPPAEPALPAPLPPVTVVEYEIAKACAISWGGQFLKLAAGTRVTDSRFGPRSVERMRGAGVELREVVG